MRSRDKRLYCAAHDCFTSDFANAETVAQNKAPADRKEPPVLSEPPCAEPDRAKASAPRAVAYDVSLRSVSGNATTPSTSSDTQASNIADKLLLGWTLLAECMRPKGSKPLLLMLFQV